MFKTKLSFLLIAIFLLNVDFLLSYPACADEISGTKTEFVSRFNSTGKFSRASDPECGAFKTGAAIAGMAIAIGVVWTGIVLVVSSVGIFTALVIVGIIAAFVGVWKAVGGLVVCQHSFVRHPVARNDDGKLRDFSLSKSEYAKCTDKNYTTEDEYFKCFDEDGSKEKGKETEKGVLGAITDDEPSDYYWPKNSIQYSQHIEICNRNHLTFGKLLDKTEDIEKDFDIREKELGNPGKGWAPQVDGDRKCAVLKAGQSETIHGSTFKAVKKMGKLCVELDTVSWMGINMTPWPKGVNIGCTELLPDPQAPMCDKSVMIFSNKGGEGKEIEEVYIGKDDDYRTLIRKKEAEGKVFVKYNNKGCFSAYTSEACYSQSGSNSLAPVPITSMVVQCIKESLDNLVAGKGSPDGKSFLSVAQGRLKNTVTAALVLALVLFALKVMSGGVRNPQEMYMLIIKFALVMYFTTGDTMSKYYEYLTKISNGLSEIVLKASSESKGICDYKAEEYVKVVNYQGRNYSVDFGYLAPWDRLDCRMLFYLGAPLDGIAGKIGTGSVAILAVLLGAAPILLIGGSVIGIIFAGGQILVAFVAILMGIFLMMVVLWMCYVFILSLIALSVIVILAPLFIPMVLFQHTKGYFDGWIKELITYSLYPVILFAFLSFMFIACDKVFYKGLKFEREELDKGKIVETLGGKKRWFKIVKDNAYNCVNNTNTLACMLQDYSYKKSSILGLFDFTYIGFNGSIIGELLKLTLILFLFYHFCNILPGMAAELAGNHRAALGSGSTPGEMTGKALSFAKAAAGGAGQVASAAAKQLKSATRSSGPKGGDSGGGGGSKSSESITKGSQ